MLSRCRTSAQRLLPTVRLSSISVRNETADSAVSRAQREIAKLATPSFSPLQKLAISARILAKEGHGDTLSGQITLREEDANGDILMWVNPYGKSLDLLTESDFILVDGDMKVHRGEGFPNRATRFHHHVYAQRADIHCLVHTHPPKTSALSMTGHPLHIGHMDTMCFFEDVQHLPTWPGIPFGDEEGELIASVLKDKWSALLAHHGLIVGGENIEEAVYRAYFFERAAAMQLKALAAVGGDIEKLPKVDVELARKARDWRISEAPVKAHWNNWAQQILARDSNVINKSGLLVKADEQPLNISC